MFKNLTDPTHALHSQLSLFKLQREKETETEKDDFFLLRNERKPR